MARLQIANIKRRADQGKIDLIRLQQFEQTGCCFLLNDHLHAGIVSGEGGHHAGQEIRGDGRDDPDGDHP